MSINLPQRRLVSQEDSAIVKDAGVPRSRFIGAWTRKTTFDAGYLVPIMVDEVLPGDHMRYNVTAYVRMSTPLFPIMDNQRIDTFFFYVPARLVWSDWVKFMGEQKQPGDSIDFTIPTISTPGGGAPVGSLGDHFGIPNWSAVNASLEAVNALPFRAYNKIWNAWFRDQNVQNAVAEHEGAGGANGETWATYELLKRNKAHDYFTSALPWPQKFTAPTVPIGSTAPIIGLGAIVGGPAYTGAEQVNEAGGAAVYDYFRHTWNTSSMAVRTNAAGTVPLVYADLSEATGVAINTLRQAWLVQDLMERDARGGTRYVELIRSHFGVTNPDFRLQRPEYIGGGQSPLQVTPVAQTAPTEGVPVGALGAAGTSVGQHSASYAATEHGYIIGLINVRSELSYQHGLHKMWSRQTRYDFYWPALAGLGEQAILRKEIYCAAVTEDNNVFGYQERWHEYRTRYSEVTGMFRSTAPGTLDAWHLAQNFGLTAPVLNSAFLQDNPPMGRILAADELATGQQYLADIMISRTATRAIPMYGSPAQLGRF